ncbi:MAG: hypothetical protein ACPG7W_09115, partial [Paracoccaceae bacterium]
SANETPGKQARFTLEDAYMTRVALDLMGDADTHPAISPSHAHHVVTNAHMHMRGQGYRHPLNTLGGLDLWIGVIVFGEIAQDGPHSFTGWFAGPLSEVSDGIAKECADWPNTTPARVILTNASRAARIVRQRAFDLGIPEGDDFGEIW